MTKVMLDAELLAKLHNLQQPLELCDAAGRVVGRVLPTLDLSQYGPLEPQIDREEIERRKKSNERRYTTAEVLAYLEKL